VLTNEFSMATSTSTNTPATSVTAEDGGGISRTDYVISQNTA
jgi:hypothetical protein